ncbi:MAG: class I SAM-dependent methyltransferase [Deltaproteobacteria bacterium]|nr:class I SAM-dependent methyltransferase [Deltaproteobacteria bacterium]
MSFNPNTLLNNPANILAIRGQGVNVSSQPPPKEAPPPAPVVAPPPYDKALYENAFGRLGLMNINNVADLGCGVGNFTGVMASRHQRPEVYIGVDMSHAAIQTARAAYPGWNFIYGDFTAPNVSQQYERFEAFLFLNVFDVIENEISVIEGVPSQKPILFSMPRLPIEGSLRYYEDINALRARYSNYLSIKSVGRLNISSGQYYMVVAERW